MKKLPKERRFKSNADKEPYTIYTEYVADEFTAALSVLYNKMDPSNQILVEGESYTANYVPHSYFKYKGKIWPIYDDDAGQQECIYINNGFFGAGAYNFFYMDEFVSIIDHYEHNNKKNKKIKKIKK